MNILSYRGGVQTVTIATMCCLGDYPMPDVAIFADPQWESQETYTYTKWFEGWMSKHGMKLTTVTAGSVRNDFLTKPRSAQIPFYTHPSGILTRGCTTEYKVDPVRREIRRMLGLKKGERSKSKCDLWLGISTDEASRMKPSYVKWITNKYPLIEMGMNRSDCIAYLKKKDVPVPPKSACIGCPFHSDYFWLDMKRNSPKEWEDACEFDDAIRTHKKAITSSVFLHRSRTPLRSAYLAEDQMDFFTNECEGHCGL